MKRLGAVGALRACYEAGPTGYVIYRQLMALGVRCEVVALSLVPTKASDRAKTDRRDAAKLARSFRAGDLTVVWVPGAAHKALRDLVRAREAAKKDQLCARHLTWIRQVQVEPRAEEATRRGYLHEVEHVAGRIARLERAIDEAAQPTLPTMCAVIEAPRPYGGWR